MIIHNVGNKVKGESLEISTEICDANNEVTNQYLKQFFFSTFKFEHTSSTFFNITLQYSFIDFGLSPSV